MPFIIDGNNVMAQRPGWHRDKSGARRRLLEQLAAFASVKRARVTAVFDGEPDRLMPEGSAYRGVRVLYAERGSDADTKIERMVESAPDARGLIVVTSDRRLAFAVRSRGAQVIRSGHFRKQMEELLESAPLPEDGERYELGDVDSWLRYFGALPEDDEEQG